MNDGRSREMSKKPLFTIILSGYQTEPYLQKALDSVANQTFRDFEVICYVEECTDRSLAICQAMAEHDSRFKVATGPKSGSGGASRNYGIDHASGEYAVFIDGDDWISDILLEKLAGKLAQTSDLDILAFACVIVQSEDTDLSTAARQSNFTEKDTDKTFSGQDAIRRANRPDRMFYGYSWLNVCRVSFLRKYRLYQKDALLEDFEWTTRAWFYAEKMVYMDESLYFYRNRQNSLTTKPRSQTRILFDLSEKIFPSLFEFACTEAVPDDILSIWGNLWFSLLYWYMFHPITSKSISDEDRKRAFDSLFSGKGREHYLQILPHVSFPKRFSAPFILLAAKGFQFPAKVYFRMLYYPLIARRNSK